MKRFRKGMLALTATMVAMSFMACNNQEETTPNNQIGRDALPEYFHITSSDTQLRAGVGTEYTIRPVSVEEIGLTEEGSKVEFDGILDVVKMNDSHKTTSEGQHVEELSLTRGKDANHVKFHLRLAPIGNMPGRLEIKANNVFITSQTGSIPEQSFAKALSIKTKKEQTLWSFDVTLKGKIGKAYDKSGVFKGYTLEVTLLSDGEILGFIKIVDAHVECSGFKK